MMTMEGYLLQGGEGRALWGGDLRDEIQPARTEAGEHLSRGWGGGRSSECNGIEQERTCLLKEH